MQNPKLLVTLEYADIPEVMLKLREIGFSKSFSQKMLLTRFVKFNWRVLVGALRRWPIVAIQALSRYLSYVYLSTVRSSSNSLLGAPSTQVRND
ncbi:hypothetical protein WA1_48765 [Scytonema hofmannii PCC 7110]|uniref:Uncharacterized protein n=1 Tax=Scytonema hofmannii PCC 7110 TaxID=128403 RepID=A0A139WTY9_9CYAN|nr:hypothetical protein WA1_48765 [Scytonema hofmannii PCC 7110]